MKIIKKILLAIIVVFILSLIGGYFYFDRKFTPPENYLKVSGRANNIALKWVSDQENPNAALLLPVQIKGIDQKFYMQLDFGSPVTVLYKKSLEFIQQKFQKQIHFNANDNMISLHLAINDLKISSENFELLNYGTKADLENPAVENIIGTIGTDLLEKRTIVLDFKNSRCSFIENLQTNGFTAFEFKKRKILFPAKIENQNLKLLYDSGTSGYELIVNKEEWQKYKNKKGRIKTEKGNSWGNVLKVVSSSANHKIQFGNKQLQLSEVTYIEGTSKLQNFLMKRSGMQGMIGNKLFLNQKLILDCRKQRFKLE
jgi:hypothetical protein